MKKKPASKKSKPCTWCLIGRAEEGKYCSERCQYNAQEALYKAKVWEFVAKFLPLLVADFMGVKLGKKESADAGDEQGGK
jgi:hypothetical protein